jgi:hypothetical protein
VTGLPATPLNRRDSDRRRLVRIVEAGIVAAVGDDHALGDLLFADQAAESMFGAAVGGDRPDDLLLAEVLRHAYPIHEPLAAREEERRLAGVGPPSSTVLSAPAGMASSCCQFRLKYPNTRSKVPSGFLIHPSKYGTTLWPN